jgi:hypothetical protein
LGIIDLVHLVDADDEPDIGLVLANAGRLLERGDYALGEVTVVVDKFRQIHHLLGKRLGAREVQACSHRAAERASTAARICPLELQPLQADLGIGGQGDDLACLDQRLAGPPADNRQRGDERGGCSERLPCLLRPGWYRPSAGDRPAGQAPG